MTYNVFGGTLNLTQSINQHCCTGVGEVSLWEFSGYEPYHVTYDLFIGDANCINVVVISQRDTTNVQLNQIVFWLNFIKTRLAPQQTFGNNSSLFLVSVCQPVGDDGVKTRFLCRVLALTQVTHSPHVQVVYFYVLLDVVNQFVLCLNL